MKPALTLKSCLSNSLDEFLVFLRGLYDLKAHTTGLVLGRIIVRPLYIAVQVNYVTRGEFKFDIEVLTRGKVIFLVGGGDHFDAGF